MSSQATVYAFSNLKLMAVVLVVVGVVIGGVAIYEYPNFIRGASTSGSPENQEVVSLEITIRDYEFVPATIEIPKGAMVKLKIKNEGDFTHGILIADFDISKNLSPGDSKLISFTADTGKSSINFFCAFPACGSPSQHGNMKGTLAIT